MSEVVNARQKRVDIVALGVDSEEEYQFPNNTINYELSCREADIAFRMAFVQGETADGNDFKTIKANSDWWSPEKIKIPKNSSIYLRSKLSVCNIEIITWSL